MKKILTPANIFIFLVLNAVLYGAVFLGLSLHSKSIELKKIKTDYYKVNQIKYGLLDAENWTNQVNEIIDMQLDSFQLSDKNEAVLKSEITRIFNRLFDEADKVLHKKQEKAKDKIKFKVINAFVDVDKFRKDIPHFTNAIMDEIDKTQNRGKVKDLLKEKLNDVMCSNEIKPLNVRDSVLMCYHCTNKAEFNKLNKLKIEQLEAEQVVSGYYLVSLMAFLLLLWFLIFYLKTSYTIAFVYSVLLSFVCLVIGIQLPMIEIDARIGELDLNVLKSHVIFNDQIIFFQSKSIIDVVFILFKTGKPDSLLVGSLIFLFSVLFPISKLICSSIYLLRDGKSNKFVKYMAFKSGKWSMADVMVVAIFMSYVGFQGILNSELDKIQLHEQSVNLLATNKSNLQIGFIIFLSFVLTNLILSEVLKRITNAKHLATAQN